MLINRTPDLDTGTNRPKQIVIRFRRRQIGPRRSTHPEQFLHQHMRRLPRIIRHLRREHSALRQHLSQSPHRSRMLRHPLKHCIRKQQIHRRIRRPCGNIAFDEGTLRQPRASLPQHILRRIQPNDLSRPIPLHQQLRGITRPTSQIHRDANLPQRHLRQQIPCRTRSLILKLQILPGTPVAHNETT